MKLALLLLLALVTACGESSASIAERHLMGGAMCSGIDRHADVVECVAQGRYFTCMVDGERVECAELSARPCARARAEQEQRDSANDTNMQMMLPQSP